MERKEKESNKELFSIWKTNLKRALHHNKKHIYHGEVNTLIKGYGKKVYKEKV